jgi:hypothetical protein
MNSFGHYPSSCFLWTAGRMGTVQKVDDCGNILSSQTFVSYHQQGLSPSSNMKRLQEVSVIHLSQTLEPVMDNESCLPTTHPWVRSPYQALPDGASGTCNSHTPRLPLPVIRLFLVRVPTCYVERHEMKHKRKNADNSAQRALLRRAGDRPGVSLGLNVCYLCTNMIRRQPFKSRRRHVRQ